MTKVIELRGSIVLVNECRNCPCESDRKCNIAILKPCDDPNGLPMMNEPADTPLDEIRADCPLKEMKK